MFCVLVPGKLVRLNSVWETLRDAETMARIVSTVEIAQKESKNDFWNTNGFLEFAWVFGFVNEIGYGGFSVFNIDSIVCFAGRASD